MCDVNCSSAITSHCLLILQKRSIQASFCFSLRYTYEKVSAQWNEKQRKISQEHCDVEGKLEVPAICHNTCTSTNNVSVQRLWPLFPSLAELRTEVLTRIVWGCRRSSDASAHRSHRTTGSTIARATRWTSCCPHPVRCS